MTDAGFEYSYAQARQGVEHGEAVDSIMIPAAGKVLPGSEVEANVRAMLEDAGVTWDENASRAATIAALALASMLDDVSRNIAELCAAITYTAIRMEDT